VTDGEQWELEFGREPPCYRCPACNAVGCSDDFDLAGADESAETLFCLDCGAEVRVEVLPLEDKM